MLVKHRRNYSLGYSSSSKYSKTLAILPSPLITSISTEPWFYFPDLFAEDINILQNHPNFTTRLRAEGSTKQRETAVSPKAFLLILTWPLNWQGPQEPRPHGRCCSPGCQTSCHTVRQSRESGTRATMVQFQLGWSDERLQVQSSWLILKIQGMVLIQNTFHEKR